MVAERVDDCRIPEGVKVQVSELVDVCRPCSRIIGRGDAACPFCGGTEIWRDMTMTAHVLRGWTE